MKAVKPYETKGGAGFRPDVARERLTSATHVKGTAEAVRPRTTLQARAKAASPPITVAYRTKRGRISLST